MGGVIRVHHIIIFIFDLRLFVTVNSVISEILIMRFFFTDIRKFLENELC